MIDWSNIEDAIYAAFLAASGATVIWSYQTGNRPTAPFVSLHMDGPRIIGQDALDHSYDAGADPGEEITLYARGLREITIRAQAFASTVVNDSSARALMDLTQARIGLPTARDTLRAAGLALFDQGTVVHVPEITGADFEGRATCEFRLYLLQTASEVLGYIAKANIDYDVSGLTGTIVVDSES